MKKSKVHFEVPGKGYQACYATDPKLTKVPAEVDCRQCKYHMALNAKEWKTGQHGRIIDFSGKSPKETRQ